MNKRIFAISGMVVSIVLVVFGILIFFGCFESASFSFSYGKYDYGYAEFGADYYTYVVNNTAKAAEGAYWSAVNLCEIANFLSFVGGIFTIGIGLLSFCGFGIVFAGCERNPKNVVAEPVELESTVEEDNEAETDVLDENAVEV